MPGELAGSADRVVAEEQAARDREPGVADHVGVADETGEAVPVGDFDFGLGAVDVGFAEGDGEADGGAEDLIIVGVIVDVAAEVVDVEAKLAEETLCDADFVVVAVRGLDRQAQDVGSSETTCWRAGNQNVFERWRLENAVVGGVDDEVGWRKITRDREARADGVLIDQQLIVVPAEAGADGPVSVDEFDPG